MRTTYTRILGAPHRSPRDKAVVDQAIAVLSKEFQGNAEPDQICERLAEPENILLASDSALAIILKAETRSQRLWLMWVHPEHRGNGIGGEFLKLIIGWFTQEHYLIRLDCPSEREPFYGRQGFHTLFSTEDGRHRYMAGPAQHRDDVVHLLPAPLRPTS